MRSIDILVFCILLAFAFSCDSESKRKHQLIHQTEDLKKELDDYYNELSSDYIEMVKGFHKDSIPQNYNSISFRLARLNENMTLISVDEHNHDSSHDDGTHDHHHHHGDPGLQLTNEDKLVVLNEFRDTLKAIELDLFKLD